MEKAEIKDLATELKSVSSNLSLLACVVAEGIGSDNCLTPQCIEDNIFSACKHLDRIAAEMMDA